MIKVKLTERPYKKLCLQHGFEKWANITKEKDEKKEDKKVTLNAL